MKKDTEMIGKLTITFSWEGEALFYSEGDNSELLAERFKKVIEMLHNNPFLIAHAFGICEKHTYN